MGIKFGSWAEITIGSLVRDRHMYIIIMQVRNIGGFLFGVAKVGHQTTKLNSPPIFPSIQHEHRSMIQIIIIADNGTFHL